MTISLIAAMSRNFVIGKNNSLPWNIKEDMKHFRETTRGHAVIMGRKTFESLSGPLPKRRNIVITRDLDYKRDGIEIVHSVDEALGLFKDDKEEIFIIGGGELYKQTMPLADRLYITHIEAEDKDANVFFSEIIPIIWDEISHEEHQKDEKNPFAYTFSIYEKI